MCKKLVGNKGSVRSIANFLSPIDNQEYVFTAGCDRHVRVFNVSSELQKECEITHSYLK